MEKQKVRIQSISKVTHDVLQIKTDKPPGFEFVPGQATEVAIDKKGWENEGRPFTFTSVPEDGFLEFTIKTYPSHNGVTAELLHLKAHDALLLQDIFGAIAYKGEGVFIAGGAGVTPFISILRHLRAKNQIGANKLLFANKAKKDIILEQEFRQMLDRNFVNILSEEQADGYHHGLISEDFLRAHVADNKMFYVCGPPPMMDALLPQLSRLNIKTESIVTEEF